MSVFRQIGQHHITRPVLSLAQGTTNVQVIANAQAGCLLASRFRRDQQMIERIKCAPGQRQNTTIVRTFPPCVTKHRLELFSPQARAYTDPSASIIRPSLSSSPIPTVGPVIILRPASSVSAVSNTMVVPAGSTPTQQHGRWNAVSSLSD